MPKFVTIITVASILAMLLMACYYFWQVKNLSLKVVLLLLIIQPIGAIFKILHLPGGDEILMAGPLAGILFGLLIGYFNFKSKKNPYFYFLAVILLLPHILYFSDITVDKTFSQVLTFLLVALIGTVKLRSQVIDAGIDKVLNIFLLSGIVTIIIDTTRQLNI